MSVLDTTFFIDLYRRDAGATGLWNQIFAGQEQASYSPVTVLELWLGRLTSEEETFYESILSLLEEVPFSSAAARRAATSLRGLQPARAERLIRDAMVGASAQERGEIVRSRNLRDFGLLSIEVESY